MLSFTTLTQGRLLTARMATTVQHERRIFAALPDLRPGRARRMEVFATWKLKENRTINKHYQSETATLSVLQ